MAVCASLSGDRQAVLSWLVSVTVLVYTTDGFGLGKRKAGVATGFRGKETLWCVSVCIEKYIRFFGKVKYFRQSVWNAGADLHRRFRFLTWKDRWMMEKVKPVSVALDARTVAVLDGWSRRWSCSRSQVVRFLAAQADAHDVQPVLLMDLSVGPSEKQRSEKQERAV